MVLKVKQEYMILGTAFGWVGVGYSDAGLWSLAFPRAQRVQVLEELSNYGLLEREGQWPKLAQDLVAYFAGKPVDFHTYDIDWRGVTSFRRRVLEKTRLIPWGEVRSYQEVSLLVNGSPRASRAVGGAMANNRLPIVIPCHRVVRSDGGLGGFGGGPAMKARLLALEGGSNDLWQQKKTLP